MKVTNNNLIKLVNILNDGRFHDGTELGEKLGITRSAIWKSIQKLISQRSLDERSEIKVFSQTLFSLTHASPDCEGYS